MSQRTIEEVREKAEAIIDRYYDADCPQMGISVGDEVERAISELLAFIDEPGGQDE